MNNFQLQLQLRKYTIKSSFSGPPSPEEPLLSPHTFQAQPRVFPSAHWYTSPHIMKTSTPRPPLDNGTPLINDCSASPSPPRRFHIHGPPCVQQPPSLPSNPPRRPDHELRRQSFSTGHLQECFYPPHPQPFSSWSSHHPHRSWNALHTQRKKAVKLYALRCRLARIAARSFWLWWWR